MKVLDYSESDINAMEVRFAKENSTILYNGDELIKILSLRNLGQSDRQCLMEISRQKALRADKFRDLEDDIALPTGLVLVEGHYAGHTMTEREGASFNTYFIKGQLRVNLVHLAKIYTKKERIVKRANARGIIMPDLASGDNVLVDENNDSKVTLLDYDGFQVEELGTYYAASDINPYALLSLAKYFKRNGLWTQNVDSYSLITSFIYACTSMNLPDQPDVKYRVDELLDVLGLDDPEIREKVKALYSDTRENVYFDDSYQRIAELYELRAHPFIPKAKSFTRK